MGKAIVKLLCFKHTRYRYCGSSPLLYIQGKTKFGHVTNSSGISNNDIYNIVPYNIGTSSLVTFSIQLCHVLFPGPFLIMTYASFKFKTRTNLLHLSSNILKIVIKHKFFFKPIYLTNS